jgi:hypothetical protein
LIFSAVFLSVIFTSTSEAQGLKPIPKLSLRYVENLAPSHGPTKKAAKPKIDSLVLEVRVELPAGWHINSEAPPDSFLVPTRVEASADGILFGKPRFPQPEMVFSSAMGEKIPLYSGVFTIQIPAQRQQEMPVTRVTLYYQACNDSMCLPPKEVSAELESDGAVK